MNVEPTNDDVAFLEELYALPDERSITGTDARAHGRERMAAVSWRSLWTKLKRLGTAWLCELY
jgi:hypothetical protein